LKVESLPAHEVLVHMGKQHRGMTEGIRLALRSEATACGAVGGTRFVGHEHGFAGLEQVQIALVTSSNRPEAGWVGGVASIRLACRVCCFG